MPGMQHPRPQSQESQQIKPKNPDHLTFGSDQEFTFQELESPLMEWILADLEVKSIQVLRKDGWDHITIKLAQALDYDVNDKIDAILEQAEKLGIASKKDNERFKTGGVRLVLNFVSAVSLAQEITYKGQLDLSGNVEAKDLKGVSITAGPLSVRPNGGTIYSNGTASVAARIFGMPLPTIAAPVPDAFANAIIDSIKKFEAIRNR